MNNLIILGYNIDKQNSEKRANRHHLAAILSCTLCMFACCSTISPAAEAAAAEATVEDELCKLRLLG